MEIIYMLKINTELTTILHTQDHFLPLPLTTPMTSMSAYFFRSSL